MVLTNRRFFSLYFYLWLTPCKRPWFWESLMAGGKGGDRGWDGWMASPTQWTWVWINSRSCWWTREAWCAVVHGVSKSWTQLSNWTELNCAQSCPTATTWTVGCQALLSMEFSRQEYLRGLPLPTPGNFPYFSCSLNQRKLTFLAWLCQCLYLKRLKLLLYLN